MKILAQFPTLARPEKFLNCLEKYINSTSGQHEIFFNINCDVSDTLMYNQEVIDSVQEIFLNQERSQDLKWHDHFCSGIFHFDEHTTKISAVNSNMDKTG